MSGAHPSDLLSRRALLAFVGTSRPPTCVRFYACGPIASPHTYWDRRVRDESVSRDHVYAVRETE